MRLQEKASQIICNGFKDLLENKHLYQHVILDPAQLEEELLEMQPSRAGAAEKANLSQIKTQAEHYLGQIPWIYSDLSSPSHIFMTSQVKVDENIIFHPYTSFKMTCSSCLTSTPFNLFQVDSIHWPPSSEFKPQLAKKNLQVFILSLICQNCRGLPEVLMIQRQGLKLTLCGRIPFEIVSVPPFIPKQQQVYFRDAIVAYNTGNILPANFMLRVFLEQYVRSKSKSPKNQRIEDLFSEYSDLLPPDFKQRFPSLVNLYNKLSADIHAATGSPELFESVIQDIEQHFAAKNIFKLAI